ncbi:uncharacterized protein LOC121397238 [Xenopus laevis]|uniref:Uncharacterized protein LOC121397238 n=1 Tax=Xenopus laevis TaxID=8355 RepID=A0A8J1LJD0_XENLA|nr:uncharacterized protein LOC121397238 [Xenopus laevis]
METQQSFSENSSATEDKSIPSVVVKSSQSLSRSVSSGSAMENSHHGCQPEGLGCSISGSDYSRCLVEARNSSTHQYPRAEGSPPSIATLAITAAEPGSSGTVRQCHHSGLSQPSRGHSQSPSPAGSRAHSDVGREEQHSPISGLHSRVGQLAGRLPQSSDPRSGRMVTPRRSFLNHYQEVGRARRRFDGVSIQQTSSTIHSEVQRSSSSSSRRTDHTMEISTRICVSSTCPSSTSDTKGSKRKMHGDSHSTTLASKSVVLRTNAASGRQLVVSSPSSRYPTTRADSASQPRDAEFDGMAVETLILKKKGFSDNVIRTMIAARKPVSSKTYHRVWRCYRDWCAQQKLSFTIFTVPRLLQFLQTGLDKGLSPGSLKSQVSALSILFQRKIANLPDVRTFLQGAIHMAPPYREPIPPWDLNLVLRALQGPPFEPLATIPLTWLTWKVVFLIAISSARRVSELSALSCQSPFLIFHSDRAVLRTTPSFLPKVISEFHINQDITIPSFCPRPKSPKEVALHALDPVRALKFYLDRTKDIRKSSSLFVLLSGAHKGSPASKTTISRWIREAIRRAYVAKGKSPPMNLRAHSTRGISTSWAFRNRASAEQVCKAATWASLHAFTKFYKFEVFAASGALFGRKVLQAAVI